MPTDLNNLAYPFDPTGLLASNKITAEQQIITAQNFRDFHFIVPKNGPYFVDSMIVKFRALDNTVRTLVEGIDYYCTHWFISASRACAKPIYGSISLLDVQLAGVLILDYQTIGGIWTLDDAAIAEILADKLNNPRTTAWDQVVDMPVAFPPIDHEWDLADLVGASEIVESLQGIEAALRSTGAAGLAAHLSDYANPHQTTKAQVGLGNVANNPSATAAEAIAGTSNALFMTPLSTLAAMNDRIIGPFNSHAGNLNNPHGTTADQVGAYSKTQSDLLLDDKLPRQGVAYDTSRFDNKTPVEYRDWALQGTSANAILFSGKTYLQTKEDILSGVAANSLQFGGFTVQQFKDSLSTEGLGNAERFGGYTYAEAKADILSGTAANATSAYGLTKAQLALDILTGTAADSDRLEGRTTQELSDYLRGEIGGWEEATVESSRFEANLTATASVNRWVNFARLDMAPIASYAAESNPSWIVSGGSPVSAGNAAIDHKSSTWLVRLETVTPNGAGAWNWSMQTRALRLSEDDVGMSFGATYLAGTGPTAGQRELRVWAKVPSIHKSFTVTQLTKDIDVLQNVDEPALEVDTQPTGWVEGTSQNLGGVATDVAALRTEVETAFTNLTTAFNTLKAQMDAA